MPVEPDDDARSVDDGGPEGDATVAEPVAAGARAAAPLPAATEPLPAAIATAIGTVSHGGAPSASLSGTKAGTTIASPLEALLRDEMLRTRWFCLIALGMVVGGTSSLLVVRGDPVASIMFVSAVAVAVAGIVFLFRRTGDPVLYRRTSTAIGFFLPTVAVAAAIPYFGAFSPAPVLVVLAVYFTGLGASRGVAAAVWALCAVSQAVTAALVIFGVTRDTGLVPGSYVPHDVQWLVQALVQMVMAGTYLNARMSRRSALLAVGELERAIRVAAQREALLLEARDELERALRAGHGRFSDQVIAGYELGDVIGRGAMGEVYAASDPRTQEPVAIKLLSRASLGNLQHVQRFFRELKTAAGIHSPNVVKVIEVGEQPVPYLVMERLDGHSLAELLRGRRALGLDQVVELVQHVGAGIAAAAAAGVIHRDIKPQNLFLHRGTWKVLDFGVARLAEHGDTLTSGQIVGTPAYMSPEQARGGPIDHRTDIYALAAVAYRSLCGQPPFQAREVADTIYRVVHTAPRRPSHIARVGVEVELVLAIGLAKRAELRFDSARELAEAFTAARDGSLSAELRARGQAIPDPWARGT